VTLRKSGGERKISLKKKGSRDFGQNTIERTKEEILASTMFVTLNKRGQQGEAVGNETRKSRGEGIHPGDTASRTPNVGKGVSKFGKLTSAKVKNRQP